MHGWARQTNLQLWHLITVSIGLQTLAAGCRGVIHHIQHLSDFICILIKANWSKQGLCKRKHGKAPVKWRNKSAEELNTLKGKQIIITSIKRDFPQSHAMNVPPLLLTKGENIRRAVSSSTSGTDAALCSFNTNLISMTQFDPISYKTLEEIVQHLKPSSCCCLHILPAGVRSSPECFSVLCSLSFEVLYQDFQQNNHCPKWICNTAIDVWISKVQKALLQRYSSKVFGLIINQFWDVFLICWWAVEHFLFLQHCFNVITTYPCNFLSFLIFVINHYIWFF